MTYETQTHALIVKPTGEPIYSEMATIIRLDDEAAGPYVIVEQHGRDDIGKIAVTHDEWPAIREAIERMMLLCQPPNGGMGWEWRKTRMDAKLEANGGDPMECLVS